MWFLAPLAVGARGIGIIANSIGRSVGTGARGAYRVYRKGDKLVDDADSTIVVSVRHNLDDAARWIGDQGKQVRFATAVALTRTAKRVQALVETEARRVFDRPTSYTLKAFGTQPATKLALQSRVFIKPRQAEYLAAQIEGGARQQKPFERKLRGAAKEADGFWTPGAGVRLNAAGNLTRGQIQQIAQSLQQSGKYGDVFIGKPRGQPNAPYGIWGRTKGKGRQMRGGIKPLLIKVQQPVYRKRFDFYGVGRRHAGRIFNEEFARAYAEAKRSVRPISPSLKLGKVMVIRL